MQEGLEIGRRARALWADGVLVRSVDLDAAAAETQRLMSTPSITAIFEATFRIEGYTTKADILLRKDDAWRLLEVKSSLHDDKGPSDEHIKDLAYTAMVLLKCGVKLASAELVLLRRDYRIGQPDSDLFITSDQTAPVLQMVSETSRLWGPAHVAVTSDDRPEPQPIFACGKCDFFESDCLGKGVVHSIFELPRLSEAKFRGLRDLRAFTITAIPDTFELTPNQRRIKTTIRTGQPWYDRSAINDLLQKVHWPAYYLDFETVKTAIPLWPDVAPHEQVVTQYSIHLCDQPGHVTGHREYLADPTKDCRGELAERLIGDLGQEGSIISYSAFEKTMISGLANRLHELSGPLQQRAGRLFDLEQVFKQAFSHPDFYGRTSIKVTLPVLVPGMSYDGLAIADGDSAVASFAKMALGQCEAPEVAKIRADLLAYCKQDTFAMVRLHEKLCQMLPA
jgi:hypothetical protein